MKNYLFRGKRVDNGEWVYGDLLQPTNEGLLNIYEISDHNSIMGDREEVIPETVGQYTGLNDKNGTKIFEGDILKVKTGNVDENGYGVVEYLQSGCRYRISGFLENPYRDQYHQRTKGEFCKSLQEWLLLEIIGNIHDNPELLEDKTNVKRKANY